MAISPRGDAFERLALRLREMVGEEHVDGLSGVERFTVVRANPLTIEQMDSDLVLEDGDPDFTIGALMRARLAATPAVAGDQVWCLREGQFWHLVDVAGSGDEAPPAVYPQAYASGAGAADGELFYDTGTGKLTYKDPAGVLHALY